MNKFEKIHINLIGAGLAGSLMAVYLAQRGFRVSVYERRPDMRVMSVDGGRSINLALSVRGLHALEETGMKSSIMEIAIPMFGRMMHDHEGELTFQPYSKDRNNCIYSVSRSELNKRLMDRAEADPRIDFRFNQFCETVDLDTGQVTLRDIETNELHTAPGSVNIGADGASSSIRYAMQRQPRFDYQQSYLPHGYKELTIPPGPDGGFQLEKNALHIWPRHSFMMIALPNLDGSFTCTLFMPYEGENSFEQLQDERQVREFFEREFPDSVPLMPTLIEDFFTNPTSPLATIRCYPWSMGDKAVILGDASHAIVPFFGQGMNAAFEDCTVLNEVIGKFAPDWRQVFQEFEQRRKPNADAIADMALENFIEMRDKVADEDFLFRKQVEHRIEQEIPDYLSRYEMVSFSRIPYAEAYRRGEINQGILDQLCARIDRPEDVDLALAEKLVFERLMRSPSEG